MTKKEFTTAATATLGRFGNLAHDAIGMYREGGERLAAAARQRWDAAFEQAKPQLDAETRKNAANARRVFARYYGRALSMSADGATICVDTVIGATIAGIERATAYKAA